MPYEVTHAYVIGEIWITWQIGFGFGCHHGGKAPGKVQPVEKFFVVAFFVQIVALGKNQDTPGSNYAQKFTKHRFGARQVKNRGFDSPVM